MPVIPRRPILLPSHCDRCGKPRRPDFRTRPARFSPRRNRAYGAVLAGGIQVGSSGIQVGDSGIVVTDTDGAACCCTPSCDGFSSAKCSPITATPHAYGIAFSGVNVNSGCFAGAGASSNILDSITGLPYTLTLGTYSGIPQFSSGGVDTYIGALSVPISNDPIEGVVYNPSTSCGGLPSAGGNLFISLFRVSSSTMRLMVAVASTSSGPVITGVSANGNVILFDSGVFSVSSCYQTSTVSNTISAYSVVSLGGGVFYSILGKDGFAVVTPCG